VIEKDKGWLFSALDKYALSVVEASVPDVSIESQADEVWKIGFGYCRSQTLENARKLIQTPANNALDPPSNDILKYQFRKLYGREPANYFKFEPFKKNRPVRFFDPPKRKPRRTHRKDQARRLNSTISQTTAARRITIATTSAAITAGKPPGRRMNQ
jgi:hypothetical protein